MVDSVKKVRIRIGSAAALVTVASVLAACGSSSSNSSVSSAATPAPAPSAAGHGVSVTTVTGSSGRYLAGPSGRALYLWVADGHNKSVCAGACAVSWPPLTTTSVPVAAAGVAMSHLGSTTRSDGVKQVTYDGHPLYYFAGDTSRGSLTGQGSNEFGAKWWLVAPSGAAITKTAGASSPASGY
jgi:predicted lipoprotein with Yx(FWY)xxD motif